ncbi:WW domain-containing oxidoreductase [Gryllus bimaculatus]|nr:WW domain-containing oxidoreductase [Gryllus bimaculatus]
MVHPAVYVLIPVLLACFRKYREYTWGRCRDASSLEGKVFLVTGASSGIGLETARALARRRARVILACRDMGRAQEAVRDIRSRDIAREVARGRVSPLAASRNPLPPCPLPHTYRNAQLLSRPPPPPILLPPPSTDMDSRTTAPIPMQLDLASLKSIRQFTDSVLKDFPKIHVLINNAGVYFPLSAEQKTTDGFEIHLGVNHLGHFLLTNLLLPKLKESAPSRVVIVTSSLYENSVDKFIPTAMPPGYSSSKCANVLFCKELAKRADGSGVSVFAVCPGFTYTRLFRSRTLRWYHYILLAPVAFIFMRTASQGAQTVLHCATSEEVNGETGLIYRDCRQYKPKKILKAEVAEELWTVSERMVKLPPS